PERIELQRFADDLYRFLVLFGFKIDHCQRIKRVDVLRIGTEVLAKAAGGFGELAGFIKSVRILQMPIEHDWTRRFWVSAELRDKSTLSCSPSRRNGKALGWQSALMALPHLREGRLQMT